MIRTVETGFMSTSLQMPTRLRRHHRLGFWAVAFSFLTVMAFATVPTPLWALYREHDGFSAFVVTIAFAVYAVGVVVSLFLVGHLSDRHGRRRVLVLAVVANIVSAVVFLVSPELPALIAARVICGFGVGALTATATAWLGELHAVGRPTSPARHAQLVATAANLGGFGVGALVSGMLAQWAPAPLVVPYVVFLVLMLVSVGLLLATPETRHVVEPRPPYRPQRVAVPASGRGRFAAAATATFVAFAAFGLFTSLAPSFLGSLLHATSLALAGAVSFSVFGAAVLAQLVTVRWAVHRVLAAAVPLLAVGLVLLVVAVLLPAPSFTGFLLGGVLTGAGAGLIFKGSVGTVAGLAGEDRRAEALAGLFLAGYVGLAGPVIGLGVLTLVAPQQVGLLVFGGLLAVGVLAVAPVLLRRPAAPTPPAGATHARA
jgi:MFS family permease